MEFDENNPYPIESCLPDRVSTTSLTGNHLRLEGAGGELKP